MSVFIRIFKDEMSKHPETWRHKLAELASDVKEVEEACLYRLAPGNLFKMVSLLNRHHISYDIHSDPTLSVEE